MSANTSDEPRFAAVYVVFNPRGSSAARVQRNISQLKRLVGEERFTIIEANIRDRTENIQKVADQLAAAPPNSLICVGGGDGTSSMVIELTLTDPRLRKRTDELTILPLWGGNANDLAFMMNGSVRNARLGEILNKGKRVPVHPLEVTLTHDGGKQTRLATNYAAFGASAFTAHKLNTVKHRGNLLYSLRSARFLMEMSTAIRSYVDVPAFGITNEDDQRAVVDYIFVNGSRIGKMGLIPKQIHEKGFTHTEFKKNDPENFWKVAMIALNRSPKSRKTDHHSFTIHDRTWAQLDGEVFEVESGCKVKVGVHDHPVYLLSTKANL